MVARVVVAAPGTGHGKTCVATGLLAALRARGTAVSGHKVGPDFVDPGYHALATGAPPRNLDPFLQGESRVGSLLRHGARLAEVAVIEGVMGLFDGALHTRGFGSTAHVAALVDTPVVLVVDAGAASRSIAALVLGFARYDPAVRVAGVILNRVNATPHEDEIREALEPTGVPVLGVLPDDDGLRCSGPRDGSVDESRGAAERVVSRLGEWVAAGVDLDAVVRVARSAPPLAVEPWNPGSPAHAAPRRPVVAAVSGRVFSFRYTETTELLAAAGLDVVDFDPARDDALPDGCAGLYLGGGLPESRVPELSANVVLRGRIGEVVRAGLPVVAERTGLLYLCRDVDGLPMTGVLDAAGSTTGGAALGYREATATADSVLTVAGSHVRGQEFRFGAVEPRAGIVPAWEWDGQADGIATATLHASFLHVHWAGHPEMAERFARAVHRRAARMAVD